MKTRLLALVAAFLLLCAPAAHAQRFTDKLDRGLVAVPSGTGYLVSWRVFAEEYYGVTYNLYRGSTLIAEGLEVSNYWDSTQGSSYQVAPVVDGVEGDKCDAVTPWSSLHTAVTVQTPYDRDGTDVSDYYTLNEISLGDVNGDGISEFLIKRICEDADTLIQSTRFHRYEMYDINSNLLWWIDMGPNCISLGDHQWDIVLYDWDEDGKCEAILRGRDNMIIHTAEGKGNGTSSDTLIIGDPTVDTRYTGMSYTCTGNEYLLYLNGETGVPYEIGSGSTPRYIEFPIPIGTDYGKDWGDSYGHRGTKIFMGAPFLDGRNASMFFARGIYTKTVMCAYDVDKETHALTKRWDWSCTDSTSDWYGQGYHNYAIADVDMDGRDEIVYGSMVIDDNGKGLSTTGLGHGDAQHCTDLDPYRWGLEQFACLEESPYGMNYRNATTGEKYVYQTASGDDGRCMAGNFSNVYPGGSGRSASTTLYSCTADQEIGTAIADGGFASSTSYFYALNWRLYWTDDFCEEAIFSNGSGEDWGQLWDIANNSRLDVDATSYISQATSLINSSKNQPCATGDILGDWREEIIMRTSDNTGFYIFHTNYETTHRVPTLWHDHQYRQAMVWQCEGYNQPPHPSFFLGELEGITTAPPPLTNRDRTEISNGGTISTEHNDTHVMVCETNSTAITVAEGANPSVATFNVPSWVQGNDDNDDITYTYYTCTVSGSGFSGDTRLVKQGEGTLILPSVTQEYTGNTDIWGGTLQFSGKLPYSPLWLNRHTTLITNGGSFRSIKADYNSTLQIGGTGTASTLTADSLYLGFGSRVIIDIDGSAVTASDQLNTDFLSVETKTWSYGPTYSSPVFEFNNTASTLSAGWYKLGTAGASSGLLTDIVIEGIDTSSFELAYITIKDGYLYLVLANTDAATVEEGTYYIKSATEDKFLTRGGNWGTELTYGEVGMQIKVESSSSGYTLSAPDTRLVRNDTIGYIFGTSGLYQDGATASAGTYTFETDDQGYYYIKNSNSNYLVPAMVVVNDYYTYYYLKESSSSGQPFQLLSATEYKSALQSRLDTQAAAAAVGESLEDVTSEATLDSVLSAEGYTATDVTSTYITNADYSSTTSGEGWTLIQTNGSRTISSASYSNNSAEMWSAPGAIIQELSLPEGLYRLTVNAMDRPFSANDYSNNSSLASLTSAGAYVYAQAGATTYVCAARAWTDYASYTNVNTMATFYTYSENYKDTLYFYTDGSEAVVIGFVKPYYTEGSSGSYGWGICNNWQLYSYSVPYRLGTPTLSIEEGEYVSVSDFDGTFTATYAEATTTEENASLQLLSSSATITLSDGTNTYSGTATVADYTETGDGKVLSIDFGDVSLIAGTTYTISIPAGIYGYTSTCANKTIEVSFTAVFNGDYYLKEADAYKYLSRGGNWGTEAAEGDYGICLSIAYNGGTYSLTDRDIYLASAGTRGYLTGPTAVYCDGNGGDGKWTFEVADSEAGTYYLKNSNGNYACFAAASGSATLSATYATVTSLTFDYAYNYLSETSTQSEAVVWQVLTEDEYLADQATRLDEQAAEAAAAAGLSATTLDELNSMDSYTPTDCTSSITAPSYAGSYAGWSYAGLNPASYHFAFDTSNGAAEIYGAAAHIYQEVNGLSEGLYKVVVKGMQRPFPKDYYTTYPTLSSVDDDLAYFYAKSNSSESQHLLMPWSDYDGYANVNAITSFVSAEDSYQNDSLYVYVGEDETLTLGLMQPSNSYYGSWAIVSDWTLTRLQPYIDVTISSAGYATLYYGDYNLQTPDGVTAYTVTIDEEIDTIAHLTTISNDTIPKATAVVLKGDQGSYQFPIIGGSYDALGNNVLLGTDSNDLIGNDGSVYYILGNKQGIGFYYLTGSAGKYVQNIAHKGYLKFESSQAAERIRFSFTDDDEATGIQQPPSSSPQSGGESTATAPKGIYTLTGVKLESLEGAPAGVYIVDGEKTLIK